VSGGFYPPHRVTCVLAGCGPPVATEKSFFSGIYFYRIQFLVIFFQILGNFHTVSSIQNNPTKFCLEN
jgi:hypothetical protein